MRKLHTIKEMQAKDVFHKISSCIRDNDCKNALLKNICVVEMKSENHAESLGIANFSFCPSCLHIVYTCVYTTSDNVHVQKYTLVGLHVVH